MLNIEAIKTNYAERFQQPEDEDLIPVLGALRRAQEIILFGGTAVDGKTMPMTEEQVREAAKDCRAKEENFDSLNRRVYWGLVAALMEKYIK